MTPCEVIQIAQPFVTEDYVSPTAQVVRDGFTLGTQSFSGRQASLPLALVRAAARDLVSKSPGQVHSVLVTEGR